jgi:hypothetical protein
MAMGPQATGGQGTHRAGGLSRPSSTHPVTPGSGARRRYATYISLGLALFIYASYLIFYSGIFHSSDAMFILAATESMVKRAEFTTDQLWWHQDAIETVAPDGEPYSKYGISASVMAAPLYILALNWPHLGMVQAVMLTNLLVTAINGLLVFKLVSSLGYRTGVALSSSLFFALGTSAMVYAHYYFTEPLSAVALTGSMFGLYLYRGQGQKRYAWLAGVAMSLAVSTKMINALFLVPLLFYAIDGAWLQIGLSRPGQTAESQFSVWKVTKALLPIGLPLVLTFAMLGAYNALRYGSPFISGYPSWERFDHPMLVGLWGLLFSSEKGLFVYNPILIASLFSFPLFWRRHRPEALTILGVTMLHVVVYSHWHDWRGGVAWGPRFLVPLLPLLVLPLAPLLAELWHASRRIQADEAHQRMGISSYVSGDGAWKWPLLVGLLAIGGLSLGVQIVGSGVSFLRYGDQYGEVAAQAGSALDQLGRQWPILGHALLFQPANWDAAWVQVGGNRVTIDWGVLVILVSFLVLATFGLIISYWRRYDAPAWLRPYQLAVVVLAGCVSLALLIRARNDNRFGGGDDYLALLQTLAVVSRPDDLVLLDNHIYADFFLNHNRSLSRWYALDRQTDASDRTVHLLTRSAQHYGRIWLVTDLSPDSAVDRPVEAWLTQHAYKIDEVDFSPYARLLLYDTRLQATRQSLNLRLGENIELVAFDLAFSDRSEPVRLALYWQALGTVSQDLSVFVQLLDARDQLVWQVDRYPADGFRPTTSWDVGEVIVDRYGWQLPAELPGGEYRLITGLYDWQTGQRLSVADSQGTLTGDHVVLATLPVLSTAGE